MKVKDKKLILYPLVPNNNANNIAINGPKTNPIPLAAVERPMY